MYGKSVKAVVVTGSVNAITTGEDVATRTYDSNEWLPVSLLLSRHVFLFSFPFSQSKLRQTHSSPSRMRAKHKTPTTATASQKRKAKRPSGPTSKCKSHLIP